MENFFINKRAITTIEFFVLIKGMIVRKLIKKKARIILQFLNQLWYYFYV